MYEHTLAQAGLNKNQAILYDILLQSGETTAGALAKQSPLKRGLTYKTLEELTLLELVEKKDEPGKVARFTPLHPIKLKDLLETREHDTKAAQEALRGILPSLSSTFQLVSGRPGVFVMEGLEGVERVAEDSLTAQTEILSFIDIEAVHKNIPKLNESYVKKRERLGKKKRLLVTYSEYNKNHFEKRISHVTDVRFLNFPLPPFQTIMQIYDHKVSYLVLTPEHMIGIIIENEWIATMHRQLFEYSWSTALAKSTPPFVATLPVQATPAPSLKEDPAQTLGTASSNQPDLGDTPS